MREAPVAELYQQDDDQRSADAEQVRGGEARDHADQERRVADRAVQGRERQVIDGEQKQHAGATGWNAAERPSCHDPATPAPHTQTRS